jgi:folylpolyglutamate synthase/dihydropteroate synthase
MKARTPNAHRWWFTSPFILSFGERVRERGKFENQRVKCKIVI